MNAPLSSFDDQLKAHPQLRERFEELLALVEAARGSLNRADEVEQRVIETLRRLGLEVLQDWADGQVAQQTAAVRTAVVDAVGHGKKNCTGIRPLG